MELTAVVPIYGPTYMSRQKYISRILHASAGIKVILICDTFDKQAKNAFLELIQSVELKDIDILYGDYGNPGDARNAALDLVSTDWFCFWDSDDEPRPSLYLEMIEKAEARCLEIAKGNYEISAHINEESSPVKVQVRLCKNLNRQMVDPGLWRYVFSSRTYGDLRFPSLKMGEDQNYLVQALIKADGIYFEEKIIYTYRTGFETQLTSDSGSFVDLNESLRLLMKIYKGNSRNSRAKDLILISYLRQIYSAIGRNKSSIASILSKDHYFFLLRLCLQGALFRTIYILVTEKVKK